jgi:hypothetical protein
MLPSRWEKSTAIPPAVALTTLPLAMKYPPGLFGERFAVIYLPLG